MHIISYVFRSVNQRPHTNAIYLLGNKNTLAVCFFLFFSNSYVELFLWYKSQSSNCRKTLFFYVCLCVWFIYLLWRFVAWLVYEQQSNNNKNWANESTNWANAKNKAMWAPKTKKIMLIFDIEWVRNDRKN